MKLVETKSIRIIELAETQKDFVSSFEIINEKLKNFNYIGYEISLQKKAIGFWS